METIVVLLKQTFDTEEKILVTPQGVDEREVKFVINPYDEYALEEALRLKEKHGGKVIAVTCGGERAQEALRTALAIGADEAIRLHAENLSDDSYAIASALAAVVEPLSPELLLAGLFAVDTGSGSVALQVAERLGLPHISAATKVTLGTRAELGLDQGGGGETALSSGEPPTGGEASANAGRSVSGSGESSANAASQDSDRDGTSVNATSQDSGQFFGSLSDDALLALVERDNEGDTETVVIPLPALITAQQGLNEPRYPSLPGIMKAKRKPQKLVMPDELPQVAEEVTSDETTGTSATAAGGAPRSGEASADAVADENPQPDGAGGAESVGGDPVTDDTSAEDEATQIGAEGADAVAGDNPQPDGAGGDGGQADGSAAFARKLSGIAAPRTVRTELLPPPPRAAGKRIGGSPEEQAAALIAMLRTEAKVL